jgi:hypothetical protein
VVLVGDPDQVVKQVQSLGIGEVVVRDPPVNPPGRGPASAARKASGGSRQ